MMKLCLILPIAGMLSACTTYSENGELVRHHFGYVKVITPAIHAPESAVRSLEVETFGVWMNVDGRTGGEDIKGYGGGLGYQFDRRDFIPLDCRFVIKAKTREDIQYILEKIGNHENKEKGLCIIRDIEK